MVLRTNSFGIVSSPVGTVQSRAIFEAMPRVVLLGSTVIVSQPSIQTVSWFGM
jgi:hypothetical protein